MVDETNLKEIKLVDGLIMRALTNQDLSAVLAIEDQVYDFPWSEQIFKGCLRAAYSNWALVKDNQVIGYALLSIAVEEAHILNICIDPALQRSGFASTFLKGLFIVAAQQKANNIFLEVRPTNTAAVMLYKKLGFKEVGRRKKYYPAKEGREDGLVLSRAL